MTPRAPQTSTFQSQSLRRLLYQAVEHNNANPYMREVRSRLENTQTLPSTRQH